MYFYNPGTWQDLSNHVILEWSHFEVRFNDFKVVFLVYAQPLKISKIHDYCTLFINLKYMIFNFRYIFILKWSFSDVWGEYKVRITWRTEKLLIFNECLCMSWYFSKFLSVVVLINFKCWYLFCVYLTFAELRFFMYCSKLRVYDNNSAMSECMASKFYSFCEFVKSYQYLPSVVDVFLKKPLYSKIWWHYFNFPKQFFAGLKKSACLNMIVKCDICCLVLELN